MPFPGRGTFAGLWPETIWSSGAGDGYDLWGR